MKRALILLAALALLAGEPAVAEPDSPPAAPRAGFAPVADLLYRLERALRDSSLQDAR